MPVTVQMDVDVAVNELLSSLVEEIVALREDVADLTTDVNEVLAALEEQMGLNGD